MGDSADLVPVSGDAVFKEQGLNNNLLTTEEKKRKRAEERKVKEEQQKIVRKEKALKVMNYLSLISAKYSKFFREKLSALKNDNVLKERNISPSKDGSPDKPKKEGKSQLDITKKMSLFQNGTLRPYQIEGVAWLSVLHENKVNGILADEMGLGKTVQVIAFICYLIEINALGPYLIVTPLSTIPNWKSEFERFAPDIPVVVLPGDAVAREKAKKEARKKYNVMGKQTYPVVITTYGVPLREANFLQQFTWQYLIVDEGHRIKNHESKLSLSLRDLKSTNRLLLTGTPLQNNITELWALLNFLLPHLFNNMDSFAALFEVDEMGDNEKIIKNEEEYNIVSTIHKVLAPFMLRRLKSDAIKDMVPKKEVIISCPMTPMQRELYEYVLDYNLDRLFGNSQEKEIELGPRAKRKCTENRNYRLLLEDIDDEKLNFEEIATPTPVSAIKKDIITTVSLANPTIMFKKIVDHPYLIKFPLDPNSTEKRLLVDENLINHSGKMQVLVSLLKKLKENGHKVLLFSTLVIMLDLIEEMLIIEEYNYQRLDGSNNLEQREVAIKEFNTNPDCFLFLISTRAGGLGLNLTSADTVIFYDRDWNPQADIQAQDRCHRIGQTKPVVVYSLILKNTIDEKIIRTGLLKRRLEKIVIRDGKFKEKEKEEFKTKSELLELKKLLNNESVTNSIGEEFSDEKLNSLLDRSDLYMAMKPNL